jgi:hypothetical protein
VGCPERASSILWNTLLSTFDWNSPNPPRCRILKYVAVFNHLLTVVVLLKDTPPQSDFLDAEVRHESPLTIAISSAIPPEGYVWLVESL